MKLSFNGRNVVARASKSKPRFRSTLSVSIRSSSGQSWDELSIARVLKGRARREAQGEINLDRGGGASAPSFITARQRNPRIDTKLAVGRPVVALSWLTFVSVSRAKGGGGGLENGRRKRGSLPDGAEGPSRNREKGDERGWSRVVDTAPWVGFVARRATCLGDDETTRVNVAINALPTHLPFPF